MICWKCKKEIKVESVFRTSECPKCHADLHCCRGCSFYEAGAHYDCRELVENPVADKERSNFCDFFEVNKKLTAGLAGGAAGDGLDSASKARNAFNSLFGD